MKYLLMMKSQQIMKKDFNDCSSSENPNIYSSKLENKYFCKDTTDSKFPEFKKL